MNWRWYTFEENVRFLLSIMDGGTTIINKATPILMGNGVWMGRSTKPLNWIMFFNSMHKTEWISWLKPMAEFKIDFSICSLIIFWLLHYITLYIFSCLSHCLNQQYVWNSQLLSNKYSTDVAAMKPCQLLSCIITAPFLRFWVRDIKQHNYIH